MGGDGGIRCRFCGRFAREVIQVSDLFDMVVSFFMCWFGCFYMYVGIMLYIIY